MMNFCRILTRITISRAAYTNLATLTRCFCPPLRLMPFSPISVLSPPGRMSMSCLRAHASNTFLYLCARENHGDCSNFPR